MPWTTTPDRTTYTSLNFARESVVRGRRRFVAHLLRGRKAARRTCGGAAILPGIVISLVGTDDDNWWPRRRAAPLITLQRACRSVAVDSGSAWSWMSTDNFGGLQGATAAPEEEAGVDDEEDDEEEEDVQNE